ncbi:unnamed protein product [Moneuplotes crassus]|uniref:C2H2-type domain-containing protein n=1 Tax=Euplotes crassus TaxID=5936 RepID=A0AAD1XQX2_EUPCR|nr:unnamed protein product [Moneuplotes crassus]
MNNHTSIIPQIDINEDKIFLPLNPLALTLEAPIPDSCLNFLAMTVSSMKYDMINKSDLEIVATERQQSLADQFITGIPSKTKTLQSSIKPLEEKQGLALDELTQRLSCCSDLLQASTEMKNHFNSSDESPLSENMDEVNQFPHEVATITDEATGQNRKIFTCRYKNCGREFNQQNNFIKHANIHTLKKPFKCTMCLERFAQKGNLKRHMRTHRGASRTNKKKFQCEICYKKYSTKFNLKVHKKTCHNICEA